jgi:hypothetical protein
VTLNGAEGGNGFGTPGKGGKVTATLSVTSGATLYLYVGGKPSNGTGGFNGGGTTTAPTFSAGGGGASDIRIGGTTLTDRVIVAGGGGGSGGGNGGAGGSLTGGSGTGYSCCGINFPGGGDGGTQTAGGAGGTYTVVSGMSSLSNVKTGENGSLGIGGKAFDTGAGAGIGGGGGGYYGGGGGGGGSSSFSTGGGGANGGGGGGGSSYADPLLSTNVTYTQGVNSGNGSVVIKVVSTCTPPTAYTVTGGGAYCSNGTGAAIGLSSSETGVTYQLKNSTGDIGSPVSGTGAAISFGNQTAAETYTVEATRTTGGCKTTMTGSATVSITTLPTASISYAGSPFCGAADNVLPTLTGTTGGTFNYTDNTEVVGIDISTGGFSSSTSGTYHIVYTIPAAGGCPEVTANTTVTVNPIPTVTQPLSQTFCNGATTSGVTFSGSVTGTVYNWTNDKTSIGLGASGTGDIATFTASNTGTAPVTATIKVTPSYTNGGVTCDGTAKTFTITVNPTATVNTVNNQVTCNGSSTTGVTFSSPTTGGTIVYNWTNDKTSIGLAASGTGDIASFTATNTGTAPVVATITVTPSYTNGGVTCTGTAKTFTITVNPTATISTITDQVICNNSSTSKVTFGSPTIGGTIAYNWTNDQTSIGLAASGSGDIVAFTATNTGTAPVTATITVTPSYMNGGVTCTGTAKTFKITVNPTPSVNTVTNQSLCNSFATTAISFSGSIATIVYSWTNDNTTIGLAASGTGDIPSFTATNTTGAPVVSTVTVTPSVTFNGVTCSGTPKTFTLTVNPTPIVSTPIAGSIYLQGGTTTLSVTASHGVEPYQYSLNGGAYQNSNLFYVRAGLYKVTVKDANGCSVTSTAIYIPDGTPPITCPPTIRIEFNQLTANGLAMPDVTGYLKTFITANDVTYSDRLYNINCGTISNSNFNFNRTLGTDAIEVLTRTFSATNTGSIISYQCSQDIYVGAPKLADVICPIDQTLLCENSRIEPTDTSLNHYTVLGTGYPTIFGRLLGQGLVTNLTTSYSDERITNTNGFTIKRTWILKNVCTGETRQCVQNLTYRSDAGTCPTALSSISGKIRREDLMDIPAKINVFNGANELLTSVTNPTYSFNNLQANNNYRITAERPNTDWINGVTSFDVALMSRHVLGIAPLSTPYQIIAADANRDGTIDAADLLHFQRLILRLDNQLKNNNSWRFVPKSYPFSDPTNPFASDFPEILNVSNLTSAVTNGDFVAIKVGDVNNSLGAANIRGGVTPFVLSVEDKVLDKNKIYEIPIRMTPSVSALQYAISIDKKAGQIETITKGDLPNCSDNNFGLFKNENTITAAWTRNPNQKFDENETFTMVNLVIRPTQTVRLSEIISINPVYTEGVAYDGIGTGAPVKLSFGTITKTVGKLTLLPNHPNPFSDETTISFILPEAGVAKVTVYDIMGKVLMTTERAFSEGLNQVVFDAKTVHSVSSGVLVVRLQTEKGMMEQKMVLSH